MRKAQIYCTLRELVADMNEKGDDGSFWERIKAASTTIEREIGTFIPMMETRKFAGRMKRLLEIDPVLSVTSILDCDLAVTDYTLMPETPLWVNGPYIKVKSPSIWSNDTVEIEGIWGKYNESESVLDSLSLAKGAITFDVSDSSVIDVGMVLKIESEQVLVTAGHGSKNSPVATAATSLLDGAVDETDEIVTVDNGAEFHTSEVLLLGNENLMIKRIIGDDLTVERGWNNTPIETHADDSAVAVYRTFAIERGVNGTTDADHTATAVSRFVVPEDVNWLCRQISGLMLMKARTGFQGRAGNAENGESFFYSEFPPNQIARVKNHYSVRVI